MADITELAEIAEYWFNIMHTLKALCNTQLAMLYCMTPNFCRIKIRKIQHFHKQVN